MLFLISIAFFWPFTVSFSQEQRPENSEEPARTQFLLDTFLSIKYDDSSNTTFTADQLLPKIHDEFLGALFVCNPFCQVVGLKLGTDWKPDLISVRVNSKNMKLMDVDDPLFPILFPENKTEANIASSQRRRARRERTTLAAMAKKIEAEKAEKALRVPKTAFENAIRYGLNGRYTFVLQNSDNNVQSDFKPQSGLMNFDLNFAYYRGKPLRAFQQWIQFEAGLDQTLFATQASLENDSKLELARSRMYFITWVRGNPFNWGIKLSQVKQDYKVSQNTLTGFSFSENSQYIGLAYKYKRFRYDIDYGLGYKISETQPFRDKLKSANQLSLEGMYCSTKQKIAGSEIFPCYGGSYLYTSNEATFNPAINPTGSVALTRHDIGIFMNIYFGEDFLR